jgi:hypothetical protein
MLKRIRDLFTRSDVPCAELDMLRGERDGYKNAYETLNAEIGQLRMLIASGRPSAAKQTADGNAYTPVFYYDGLWTDPAIIHNHDFMRDERYLSALRAAEAALVYDHKMYWRLHVSLWCAQQSATLSGDFVECGVWRGFTLPRS